MTARDQRLLQAAGDLLGQLQTMLAAATIDEQIAIEHATVTIYGPNEGDHYNRLLNEITTLRDDLHDHLENQP